MSKTAEELQLSQVEYNALADVKQRLLAGELIHIPVGEVDDSNLQCGFNMVDFFMETKCGTACCIAGWADKLHKTHFASGHRRRDLSDGLAELFFVYPSDGRSRDEFDPDIDQIKPDQAAAALTNYFDTGRPNWEQVLGE